RTRALGWDAAAAALLLRLPGGEEREHGRQQDQAEHADRCGEGPGRARAGGGLAPAERRRLRGATAAAARRGGPLPARRPRTRGGAQGRRRRLVGVVEAAPARPARARGGRARPRGPRGDGATRRATLRRVKV